MNVYSVMNNEYYLLVVQVYCRRNTNTVRIRSFLNEEIGLGTKILGYGVTSVTKFEGVQETRLFFIGEG
jgi:hypothetical protein